MAALAAAFDKDGAAHGLAERLSALQAAIEGAIKAAGRDTKSVRLVAVSKLQPPAAVALALRLGQTDFGENYAQELRDKHAALLTDPTLAHEIGKLRWHFIGPLQRNKVHLVVGRACLIHSVDNLPLIEAMKSRVLRLRDKTPEATADCLIQVNVAGEAQKAGCTTDALPALLDAIALAGGLLRCRGLMCMPPESADPEASRPYFRRMKELQTLLSKESRPHVELCELSMGMSHDFAVAIAEGATLLRVGTALFGARKPPH